MQFVEDPPSLFQQRDGLRAPRAFREPFGLFQQANSGPKRHRELLEAGQRRGETLLCRRRREPGTEPRRLGGQERRALPLPEALEVRDELPAFAGSVSMAASSSSTRPPFTEAIPISWRPSVERDAAARAALRSPSARKRAASAHAKLERICTSSECLVCESASNSSRARSSLP